MSNNKITHSTIFGLSGIISLFLICQSIWMILGLKNTYEQYWQISKSSTLQLISISLAEWLIPLIVFLTILYISYSFISNHRISNNKAKISGVFLILCMLIMIILTINQYYISVAGGYPLLQGILLEILSLITLIPFIIYIIGFKKGKKTIQI